MKKLVLAALLTVIPAISNAQDVQVLALTCTFSSAGPEVEGQIKNISNQPLKYVKVQSTFLDSKGKFVSASPEIQASFNPILPGQTSLFDGFGGLNPEIKTVTIAPALAEGPALQSSGISSAPCVAAPS